MFRTELYYPDKFKLLNVNNLGEDVSGFGVVYVCNTEDKDELTSAINKFIFYNGFGAGTKFNLLDYSNKIIESKLTLNQVDKICEKNFIPILTNSRNLLNVWGDSTQLTYSEIGSTHEGDMNVYEVALLYSILNNIFKQYVLDEENIKVPYYEFNRKLISSEIFNNVIYNIDTIEHFFEFEDCPKSGKISWCFRNQYNEIINIPLITFGYDSVEFVQLNLLLKLNSLFYNDKINMEDC